MKIPWGTVNFLRKYFPNLTDLYVYYGFEWNAEDSMHGSFPLDDDVAGVEYIRRINLINEIKENRMKAMKLLQEQVAKRFKPI